MSRGASGIKTASRRGGAGSALRARTLTAAVTATGLVLAVLLSYGALHHERSRVDSAFQIAAREHATTLSHTWTRAVGSVRDLADLFEVNEVVSRNDFTRLANSILARNRAIRRVEWLPRVTDLGREVFVARASGQLPGFAIRERNDQGELVRAPQRPVYYPALFVAPLEGNRAALGYNASNHPARKQVIDRAVERIALSVSPPMPLARDVETGPSLRVFVPVVKQSGYVHARGVRGLAQGVFRIDALVSEAVALLRSDGLRVTVSDITRPEAPETLHRYMPATTPAKWYEWPSEQSLNQDWDIGGRTYRTDIAAVGGRFAYDLRGPAIALALGLGVTALAAWLVRLLVRRERAVRRVAEQRANELNYLSRHDPRTGLLNRAGFQRELELTLARVHQAPKRPASLCLFDLDQFKLINDVCGHEAGDALIGNLARRLSELLGGNDELARVGGDEFGLLLHDHDAERAATVAARYLEAVSSIRFNWGERTFPVSASVGIVEINDATLSTTSAMSYADAACHIAKDNGRNRIHVYREDDHVSDHFRAEMTWVSAIREALEENRLTLFCQPIRACRRRHERDGVRRMELLLRLRARDGTLIEPGMFLPAAERYGLMPSIDRWVISELTAMLRDRETADTLWFVNLSGQTLGDLTFCDHVLHLLHQNDIAPSSLCFEITETAAISRYASARTFMDRLRNVGCRFALDDFGSGMASFSYLKELRVDYLKIDGSFIRGVVDTNLDRAIAAAIRDLAGQLRLHTIAECVEDERVLAAVRELGLHYAQGHHLGRAQPLATALCERPPPRLTVIQGQPS